MASLPSGEPITIRVRSRFHQPRSEPMVGILIRNRIGMDIYGTNTQIEQIVLGASTPVRNWKSISPSTAGSRRIVYPDGRHAIPRRLQPRLA